MNISRAPLSIDTGEHASELDAWLWPLPEKARCIIKAHTQEIHEIFDFQRDLGRSRSDAAVVIFVSACSKADEPADADGIDSGAGVVEASAPWKLDRTVLPIQEPERPTYSELDVRNAEAPPRFEVKAPEKAPNVVIVLIDDVGFGATSTFGGPIQTPTLDKLADEGLRYNNFHTTALCSPTRNALKTGRNHHTTNTGSIMETATAFPGNTGQIPNSVAPLAEMLRLNGYSTAAFGKWHETAAWETSVSGPYDRWPTHQGFDKFYGFIGGETDQWYPLTRKDTTSR